MIKLNTNPTVKSRNSTSPRRDYAKTSILKANSLNKSRNANEVLLTHLEEKRGCTLSAEEQKIALYFAYQSDHHFRDYLVENSNDTQIGFNYTSDINAFYRSLSPQHKDFFDEVKSYFAEQASQFFIQNGWLNTSTDAVADLFSGVDYSFSRYLNSKYNMNVCAIDTAFEHSDMVIPPENG